MDGPIDGQKLACKVGGLGGRVACGSGCVLCVRRFQEFAHKFMPLHCAWWSVQGFPPVLDLALPVVNRTQVGVHHDGQTCYNGVEARQVLPEAWRALDAALQPQGEASTNGLRLEGDPDGCWVWALITAVGGPGAMGLPIGGCRY